MMKLANRWTSRDQELYVIFSLESLSVKDSTQMSFVNRRPYKSFDKDFGREMMKNYPNISDSCWNSMVNLFARKAKSKFNTLKRFFLRGNKITPDFPLFIYFKGSEILKKTKAERKNRLQLAMKKWREVNDGKRFVVRSKWGEKQLTI